MALPLQYCRWSVWNALSRATKSVTVTSANQSWKKLQSEEKSLKTWTMSQILFRWRGKNLFKHYRSAKPVMFLITKVLSLTFYKKEAWKCYLARIILTILWNGPGEFPKTLLTKLNKTCRKKAIPYFRRSYLGKDHRICMITLCLVSNWKAASLSKLDTHKRTHTILFQESLTSKTTPNSTLWTPDALKLPKRTQTYLSHQLKSLKTLRSQ